MSKEDFDARCEDARERVKYMDKVDGWKNREPDVIYAALRCGLTTPETNAAFHALVMLEDVVKESRKERATP